MADSSQLVVVDVSDPEDPVVIGDVAMPATAQSVVVSGTVAYVVCSSEGLVVVDVSNPMAPGIIGSVDTASDAVGLTVSGSTAYVADYARLQVIDVSSCQPSCPADVDGDGLVGFEDLVAVLAAWGNEGGPEDVDGSGVVDFQDIVLLLAAWGPCP